MRILHLTHQGDEGGSTNSITWLCRGLARRGHDVFLACRPESLIARRFREGEVRLVDMRLSGGLPLVGASGRWRDWLRENRIDVANAHASLDRHLLSYVRIRGTDTRIVHTRRNVALSSGGALRMRFDAATTDAVVAVSGYVADDLVRRGLPRDHVRVIRNGLPLEEIAQPEPDRVAALREQLGLREGVPVVSVFARRKSQEEVLLAAARLARPLEILFAGIESDPALERAAEGLPAPVRWRCLGFRDDVAQLAGLTDVFVLPSVIEGFSLALLEAMFRGLPCIATAVGGNPEALAEGAGIVYPQGDTEALARELRGLLDDPDRRRALGRRARARAIGEFDVARTVERTEELFASLEPAR